MNGFWDELDDEVLRLLSDRPMTVAELAGRLGVSDAGMRSIVGMLACDGKVLIDRVEAATPGTLAA